MGPFCIRTTATTTTTATATGTATATLISEIGEGENIKAHVVTASLRRTLIFLSPTNVNHVERLRSSEASETTSDSLLWGPCLYCQLVTIFPRFQAAFIDHRSLITDLSGGPQLLEY